MQFRDDAYLEPGDSFDGSISESGSEESQSSQGFGARLVSCLSIMRASSPGETHPFPEGRTPGAHAKGSQKPPVGCTFEVGSCQQRRHAAVQDCGSELGLGSSAATTISATTPAGGEPLV